MKKKEILTILILGILYFSFFNSSKILAIDIPRVDEEAFKLCEETDGEVVKGTRGRLEGPGPYRDFPAVFVECVCPDKTRQNLYVGAEGLEEWQGCKIINRNQLIAVVIFQAKAFLQKYYRLLLFWLLVLVVGWWVLRLVLKKIKI